MKILNVSVLDNNNEKMFTSRGVRLPQKWATRQVSETTIKKVSDAIAATGVAGLMMGISNKDYIDSISVPIDRANLSPQAMKILKENYDCYPTLMDTLLTETNSHHEIRALDAGVMRKSIEAYDINPELTEKLISLKDEKGNFKYSMRDVLQIVNANDINPDLLEISMQYPSFVNTLLDKTNFVGQPLWGVKDIEAFCNARDVDKELTTKLINHQYGADGNARFTGAEALCIVKNRKNKLLNSLLEQKNVGPWRYESKHRFNGEQILRIMKACKTSDDEKKLKQLMNLTFKVLDVQYYIEKKAVTKRLSGEDIAFIMESDSIKIAKAMSHTSEKTRLNNILEIKNEELSLEQMLKLLKIKDENNKYIFNEMDMEKLSKNKATCIALKTKDRNFGIEKMLEIEKLAFEYPEVTDMIFNKTYKLEIESPYFVDEKLPKHEFKFDDDKALKLFSLAKRNPELVYYTLSQVEKYKYLKKPDLEKNIYYHALGIIDFGFSLSDEKLNKLYDFVKSDNHCSMAVLYLKAKELYLKS